MCLCVCVLSVKVKLRSKIYDLSITNLLHTKHNSRLTTLNLAVKLCSVSLDDGDRISLPFFTFEERLSKTSQTQTRPSFSKIIINRFLV